MFAIAADPDSIAADEFGLLELPSIITRHASEGICCNLFPCLRACCFSRTWMFSERKMGTLARLMAARSMAPKSVKSDQPTIKRVKSVNPAYALRLINPIPALILIHKLRSGEIEG